VNSFGLGGTNAHVVLDDAYHYLLSRNLRGNHCTKTSNGENESEDSDSASVPGLYESVPQLLVLSAADENGLHRLGADYGNYFSKFNMKDGGVFLRDLAWTLNTRRSSLAWKSFIVTGSMSKLVSIQKVMSKPLQSPNSNPKLGMIFTGQGAQWPGMGQELIVYPVFKKSLLKSQYYLEKMGCKWSLIGAVFL
jgi:acyl transferase domain-containing protein